MRRHRRLHWARSRASLAAAAPCYESLAVGGWHAAKEERRIEREVEKEAKAFEASFAAWDKKMTRSVMAKPLHEDWVPQMGNDSTGKPKGYFNVPPAYPAQSSLICAHTHGRGMLCALPLTLPPSLPPSLFLPPCAVQLWEHHAVGVTWPRLSPSNTHCAACLSPSNAHTGHK